MGHRERRQTTDDSKKSLPNQEALPVASCLLAAENGLGLIK
jgi:hypothetical protein